MSTPQSNTGASAATKPCSATTTFTVSTDLPASTPIAVSPFRVPTGAFNPGQWMTNIGNSFGSLAAATQQNIGAVGTSLNIGASLGSDDGGLMNCSATSYSSAVSSGFSANGGNPATDGASDNAADAEHTSVIYGL